MSNQQLAANVVLTNSSLGKMMRCKQFLELLSKQMMIMLGLDKKIAPPATLLKA